MKQQFKVTDVAALEVQQPWTGLPNLVTSPYPVNTGLQSASQWRPVGSALTAVIPRATGMGLTTTAPTPATGITRTSPITVPAGATHVRAQGRRVSGASTVTSRVEIYSYDVDDELLGTAQSATRTNAGVSDTGTYTLPVGTTTVQMGVRTVVSSGAPEVVSGDFVLVAGSSAAVAAAPMLVEPAWTNIIGPTLEVGSERDELQVGVLTVRIADSALDPSNVDLIRPGRRVRFVAIIGGVREQLFGGKILTGSATYDLKGPGPDTKRTRVTLTAVDSTSPLTATPAPEGVGTIDELPYVLAAGPFPWNVNGSTVGVDPDTVTVVSRVEQASVVDQLAITRDTAMGYAWVDRAGVTQAWDPDEISTAVAAVLDESDYSDLDVSFDTDRCINTVTVKHLAVDPGTGETAEVSYGPYVDADSVRTWGARAAEFTVHGIDEATLDDYAAAILAANGAPAVRVNSVTLPLRTLAELAANARRDLYDLVTVSNTRAGVSENLRVVSVSHRITGRRWFVDLAFAADSSVAPPQVTPSPSEGQGQTVAQRLRPVGETTPFYGTTDQVPAGWLVCDGDTYDTAAYPRLYTHLQAMVTAGVHTDATLLPNLVDRFPIGAGVKTVGSSGGSPTKNLAHLNLPNAAMRGSTADGSSSTTFRTGGAYNTAVQPIVDADAEPVDVMPPWRALHFIIRAV